MATTIPRGPAVLAVALMTIAAPGPSSACDSTGCLLASRGQGSVAPKGRLRADLSFRYINLSKRMDGNDESDRVRRPWIDFQDGLVWPTIHDDFGGIEKFLQMDFEYGIAAGTSLIASVPLVAERRFPSGDDVCGLSNLTSGIGDVVVGLRRTVRASHRGVLTAGLAVKIPTARSDVRSPSGLTVLDPMFQPGSGSLDGIGSIQYSFRALHPDLDWTASFSYQANRFNGLRYQFGNEAIGTIGVAHGLVGPLLGSLQVKLYHEDRGRLASQALASTGATIAYVTPGVRVNMRQTSLYALVQVPAYRYVNEQQLAPRMGVVTGLSRTF